MKKRSSYIANQIVSEYRRKEYFKKKKEEQKKENKKVEQNTIK